MTWSGRQLGVYTIHERVGVGGFGEVSRAIDTRLNRPVAIKFLSPDVADERRAAGFSRRPGPQPVSHHPS